MEEENEDFERTTEEKFVGVTLVQTHQYLQQRVTRPADTQNEEIIKYHRTMRGLQGVRHFHNAVFTVACLKFLDEVKDKLNDVVFCKAALLFCRTGFVFGVPIQSRKDCMMKAFDFYDHPRWSLQITTRINATYDRFPFRRFDDDRDYVADITHHHFAADEDTFKKTWSLMLQEFQSNFKPEEAGKAAKVFKNRSRKILTKLLVQSHVGGIFRTEHFRKKFERRARKNIVRMLRELTPKRG